jgi:phage tail protein X
LDKQVDIYTTIQGDTWDHISYKVYGKDKYSKDLMRANPKYLNVVFFSGGTLLICPDISEEETATLPPWR